MDYYPLQTRPRTDVSIPTGVAASVFATPEVTFNGGVTDTVETLSFTTAKDNMNGISFEGFRDSLRKKKEREDPQDYERMPGHSHFNYRTDSHGIQFLHPHPDYPGDVLAGEPLVFNTNGWSQLCSLVLPSHGKSNLEQLGRLVRRRSGHSSAPIGLKAAQMNMILFMENYQKPLTFRTLNRNGKRIVRATLSQTFQTYDNLELVEDMMESMGPRRCEEYVVVQANVHDNSMRLRVVRADQEWKINEPMPMFEAWNSEVGRRSVGIAPGFFTLWCLNGCGNWEQRFKFRWNHTGNTSTRIKNGVAGAIDEALLISEGTVDKYLQARDTAIDDALEWFQRTTSDVTWLGDVQRERVNQALLTEQTVFPGRGLGSLVDAVTFAAHEESNPMREREMELLAGQLLTRGLNQADNGRIAVPLA